jgi:hypothetical protein
MRNLAQNLEEARRWRKNFYGQCGDKQFDQEMNRSFESFADGVMKFAQPGDSDKQTMDRSMAVFWQMFGEIMTQGELYVLRGPAEEQVMIAKDELPHDTTLRRQLLRSKAGVLWLDKGLRDDKETSYSMRDGKATILVPGHKILKVICWHATGIMDDARFDPNGMVVMGWCQVEGQRSVFGMGPVEMLRWKFGTPWHSLKGDPVASSSILMTTLLFMEQQLLVDSRHEISRAEHRYLKRHVPPATSPETILTFRKKVYKPQKEPSGRKLTVRHLRRGRWVPFWIKDKHPMFDPKGPCPQRYVKWLIPIIVGDESLPMKPFGDRVFDIRR